MAWSNALSPLGAALLAALTLTACSVAGPRSSPLPASGPTMKEIYEGHSRATRVASREALPLRAPGERSPGPVKESALRQIEYRFPRVPNPDLVMYVFPHLAQSRYPVPGYFTAFPMYEQVHYQMPGEGYSLHDTAAALQR